MFSILYDMKMCYVISKKMRKYLKIMLAGYMRRYSLLTGLILFSFVAFAEPPDTKWKDLDPGATGTITLETIPDVEGETAWKFTLTTAGKLAKSAAGTTSKLNFRTLALPTGYAIKDTGTTFSKDTTIEELYWPDTVTAIPNSAFLTCTKLKICDFPEGTQLETIGNYAFQHGSGNRMYLKRFRMSDTITSIGQDAFYKNYDLVFDGPMLPNSYTKIYARRFNSISSNKLLQDGRLVVGGSGANVTWVPVADKNNNNKFFS